jgi:hypothetical protein
MPNRSRKKRQLDPNVTAFSIIQAIASEPQHAPVDKGKDPAAVALGRKGGPISQLPEAVAIWQSLKH